MGLEVFSRTLTVDSKKLEYGPGTMFAGFPSLGFGLGGLSYSNFLASTGEG